MEHRARVLEILALLSSTSGNISMDFVSREFNTDMHITRYAVLKKRPK